MKFDPEDGCVKGEYYLGVFLFKESFFPDEDICKLFINDSLSGAFFLHLHNNESNSYMKLERSDETINNGDGS